MGGLILGINNIRDEEEYRRAILRFLEIYNAPTESFEGKEAAGLSRAMQEYENNALNRSLEGYPELN